MKGHSNGRSSSQKEIVRCSRKLYNEETLQKFFLKLHFRWPPLKQPQNYGLNFLKSCILKGCHFALSQAEVLIMKTSIHQQYIDELSEEEMKALNLVSFLFDEEQQWPSERALRQKLKLEIGKEKYEAILEKLSPHFLFCSNKGSRNAHYQLTLAGMCALDEQTFKLVCRYFDYLKEEYHKDPDVKFITSEELQMALDISDYELLQLRTCIDVGGLWGESADGFSKDKNEKNQNWKIGLYRDIDRLDDADSSEAYLKELLLDGFKKNSSQSITPAVKVPHPSLMFYGGATEFEQMLSRKIIEASLNLFRNGHYSEASLRAIQALEKEVQIRSRTTFTGVELMNKAFSPKRPLLKFNNNQTESDTNEQEGLMFMFRGVIQAIRNLHAHDNIKTDELEAKRIMILSSFLIHKLEISAPYNAQEV
jgi:uncharacterized protein (TIGR02391 family)